MTSINFSRTYPIHESYFQIKEHAIQVLEKYVSDAGIISFNDAEKSVTFSSERLIPANSVKRPQVLLLFSNPHPHSVRQGMFLSSNTRGRENQFWPVMENAGLLPIAKEKRTPKQLVEICNKVLYDGPFTFIFYCYYVFPSNYPNEILKIFGKEYKKK